MSAPHTLIHTEETLSTALAFARGHYQESLIHGESRWSGSDLAGKARQWSGSYATSRSNLIERLADVGLTLIKVRLLDYHGQHCMVIAADALEAVKALQGYAYEVIG